MNQKLNFQQNIHRRTVLLISTEWMNIIVSSSPSLRFSCLRLIDKWPPQMWLFFSFIFHAQKNMRPIWLQPPPLPRAASGYTWDSLAKLNTPEQNNTQKPLLQGLLQSFCLPAAGASCDPGPLSCTLEGNEGCWAEWHCWRESMGFKVCVCVCETAVGLYVVLSQTIKCSFLSTHSCCCLRATFPLSEFVLLWLFMPKSCQAATALRSTISSWAPTGPLYASFLPLACQWPCVCDHKPYFLIANTVVLNVIYWSLYNCICTISLHLLLRLL